MKAVCFVLFVLSVLTFVSCEALPFDYSRSQSWFIPLPETEPDSHTVEWATVTLAAVTVDRAGGRDSVQKELTALAPLYFWKQGCRVVLPGEAADFTAEIEAREREYISGWRTKRSLAVEVRLWQNDGAGVNQAVFAAGRTVAVGNRSFSSSDTAGRMLERAVKQAVKQFDRQKKEN